MNVAQLFREPEPLTSMTTAVVKKARPPSFAHCRTMLARQGIVQFAKHAQPDLAHGYCLDDNCRALLAAVVALGLDPEHADARTVGEAGLRFVLAAQRSDGLFHNLMDADGRFCDPVGSPESMGRTVWACGVAARCAPDPAWRELSLAVLSESLRSLGSLGFVRSRAYAVLGLAAVVAPERAAPIPPVGLAVQGPLGRDLRDALGALCAGLLSEFDRAATDDWAWWEPELTYANARLPEALLRGAAALDDQRLAAAGLRALTFLESVTQSGDTFVPIGNDGWYRRGGHRAVYDQQPIEACAMVDMWLAAQRLTGDKTYRDKALVAFEWFLGRNTEGLVVARPEFGGCRDGLKQGRLNENMGAESTLSYLHAHSALAASFAR